MQSPRSRAIVAASLAASAAVIRHWAEAGGTEDLAELMNQAFDALRQEFPG